MPWLLQHLVQGESPGAYSWVETDHIPAEGEVLVQNDPVGQVWDAATSSVRNRTVDEQAQFEASRLALIKAKKRAELVAAADAAYQAEIPSFAGVVVAAKFVPPGNTQYLNARELTIFNKIQAGYSKVLSLLDQVDAATTTAEVQAIVW